MAPGKMVHICNGFARGNMFNETLFKSIYERLEDDISSFSFRDLTLLLNAFSRLGVKEPSVLKLIFSELLTRLQSSDGNLEFCSDRDLSLLVSSCGRLRVRDINLLSLICHRASLQMSSFSAQSISSLCSGLSALNFAHEPFMLSVAVEVRRLKQNLGSHHVVSMLNAFANLSIDAPEAISTLKELVPLRLQHLGGGDVGSLCSSLHKLKSFDKYTSTAIENWLVSQQNNLNDNDAKKRLETLTLHQLASISLAIAHATESSISRRYTLMEIRQEVMSRLATGKQIEPQEAAMLANAFAQSETMDDKVLDVLLSGILNTKLSSNPTNSSKALEEMDLQSVVTIAYSATRPIGNGQVNLGNTRNVDLLAAEFSRRCRLHRGQILGGTVELASGSQFMQPVFVSNMMFGAAGSPETILLPGWGHAVSACLELLALPGKNSIAMQMSPLQLANSVRALSQIPPDSLPVSPAYLRDAFCELYKAISAKIHQFPPVLLSSLVIAAADSVDRHHAILAVRENPAVSYVLSLFLGEASMRVRSLSEKINANVASNLFAAFLNIRFMDAPLLDAILNLAASKPDTLNVTSLHHLANGAKLLIKTPVDEFTPENCERGCELHAETHVEPAVFRIMQLLAQTTAKRLKTLTIDQVWPLLHVAEFAGVRASLFPFSAFGPENGSLASILLHEEGDFNKGKGYEALGVANGDVALLSGIEAALGKADWDANSLIHLLAQLTSNYQHTEIKNQKTASVISAPLETAISAVASHLTPFVSSLPIRTVVQILVATADFQSASNPVINLCLQRFDGIRDTTELAESITAKELSLLIRSLSSLQKQKRAGALTATSFNSALVDRCLQLSCDACEIIIETHLNTGNITDKELLTSCKLLESLESHGRNYSPSTLKRLLKCLADKMQTDSSDSFIAILAAAVKTLKYSCMQSQEFVDAVEVLGSFSSQDRDIVVDTPLETPLLLLEQLILAACRPLAWDLSLQDNLETASDLASLFASCPPALMRLAVSNPAIVHASGESASPLIRHLLYPLFERMISASHLVGGQSEGSFLGAAVNIFDGFNALVELGILKSNSATDEDFEKWKSALVDSLNVIDVRSLDSNAAANSLLFVVSNLSNSPSSSSTEMTNRLSVLLPRLAQRVVWLGSNSAAVIKAESLLRCDTIGDARKRLVSDAVRVNLRNLARQQERRR